MTRSYGKPRNVTELLARPSSPVAALRREAASAASWREFVITSLDRDIGARITGAALRHGRLTVLVESAAWAARVRLAALDIMRAARARDPGVTALVVRVVPR